MEAYIKAEPKKEWREGQKGTEGEQQQTTRREAQCDTSSRPSRPQL